MILGILLVMSPMLLLVVFVLKGESKRQRARADAWGREIAEAVGGRYVPVSDLDNPWVTFAIGGRAAEFTFHRSETPPTTVDIAVSGL